MAAVGTPTRISYGALTAAIGGLLLILGEFLEWGGSGDFGQSAFEAFDFVDIALLVVGLLAIAVAVTEIARPAGLNIDRPGTLTILGVIATSIVLTFLIESDDQKIGLFLSTLGALAILAGGIIARRAPHAAFALGGGRGPGAAGGPGGGFGGQPGVGQPGGYGQQPPQPGGFGEQPPPTQPLPAQQQQAVPPPQPPPGPAGQATTAHQIPQDPSPAPAQQQQQQQQQPPAPPGGAAGWHSDPYGQKRLRWWDGASWTEHTAD